MEETMKDIQSLLDMLAVKEKKRRRNALLYLALPLLAGLALSFWTAHQAQQLRSLQRQIDDVRTQLKRSRAASEYIRIGIDNYHARKYADAVAAYDRAIELDPMNPVIFDLKGYSLLRNGEYQKAVETLKRSIEIDPTYIWGHYNLSLTYWAAGDRSKAVEEVKKILELNPSFRDVIRSDGQFNKFNVSPEYRVLTGP
jgi:tetratricopeptide (TPR) repeat protein